MRRQPKLSGDNEFDIKFILMFTAGFVVVSSVLLVIGYGLLTVTGVLGQGLAEGTGTPTPEPSPTVKPTAIAIGVPTTPPEPTPIITPAPTPTPSPTPVPSPYKVGVQLNQIGVGSMRYIITFSMVQGYESLDMTRTRLAIKDDWGQTYCDYSYNEYTYWLDGNWSNDNGDNRLDPTGESYFFEVDARSLDIPLDRDTRLTLTLDDGTKVVNLPIPSFQNQADLPGESPDPGSGSYDNDGDNMGGDGTGGDPWISDIYPEG